MSDQLIFLDTDVRTGELRTVPATHWRLDEHTKRIGRNGIAAARAALRESRPRYPVPDTQAA